MTFISRFLCLKTNVELVSSERKREIEGGRRIWGSEAMDESEGASASAAAAGKGSKSQSFVSSLC